MSMTTDFILTIYDSYSSWWDNNHSVLIAKSFNIAVIIIISIIAKTFGSNVLKKIFDHSVREDQFKTKTDRDKRLKTLNSLIDSSVKFIITLIAILLVITEIKPSLGGPLFASAGIIGVALGFGARRLIEDFTSGAFIILENQYRVGDVIKLNDVNGVVESISIRTTVLRDLDGNVHHISNGSITHTTNKTMDYSNLNEDIRVDYKTSLGKLTSAVSEAAENLAKRSEVAEFIIDKPKFKRVTRYDSTGLTVKIIGKTIPSKQWETRGIFLEELKKSFEKHKINFSQSSTTSPTAGGDIDAN